MAAEGVYEHCMRAHDHAQSPPNTLNLLAMSIYLPPEHVCVGGLLASRGKSLSCGDVHYLVDNEKKDHNKNTHGPLTV